MDHPSDADDAPFHRPNPNFRHIVFESLSFWFRTLTIDEYRTAASIFRHLYDCFSLPASLPTTYIFAFAFSFSFFFCSSSSSFAFLFCSSSSSSSFFNLHASLLASLTAASIPSFNLFLSNETGSSSLSIASESIHLNSVWGYLTLAVAAESANQNTRPGLGLESAKVQVLIRMRIKGRVGCGREREVERGGVG